MNWADWLAPRYHLACRPDGSVLQTGSDAWEHRMLGFDRQTLRFVTVHALLPRSLLSPALCQSVGERIYLAGRISHPGLFNVTDYGEHESRLFYVTELEEGELLSSYLARVRFLPLSLAIDLAVQLAALFRHLANHPRILAHVTLGDLLVASSPGQSLCLRFSGLGLNREESSVESKGIEQVWLPQLADLLWDLVGVSVREDPQLKFSEHGSSVLLDPFRSFLQSIRIPGNCPTSQTFRELERDLHHHLYQFLRVLDSHRRWATPEECISLRPTSHLSRLLIDEGILTQWQDHNFEFAPELYSGHSRFALAVHDVRTGNDVAFQILPTHGVMGDTGLESLYRRLGQPGLREDSPLLRAFFLRCEESYTLLAEEAVHGFNLVNLLERRVVLYSNEALAILQGLNCIFQDLENISSMEDLVAPWSIYLDFAPAPDARDSHCPTSRRLRDWPAYRLKARLGLTTADFTRPLRSEWEEIVYQLQGAFRSTDAGFHYLDISFAALAVYLLEYRRYHNLLVSGDPRPRAAVSCARLHNLLGETLLSDQPHSPEVRQVFLDSLERQLEGLAYPVEDGYSSCSASDPATDALLQSSELETEHETVRSPRQRQITLLHRLLRRETSRGRIKRAKPLK